MTIEQLVAAYIYKNRELRLQNIGSITLSGDVVVPEEIEKEFVFPENSFVFTEDQKIDTEEAFVDFVTTHTRKIKPLAASDVDSYFNLHKQFINIGKPMIIPGVGSIHKNDAGTLEFTQGKPIQQKLTTPAERTAEKEKEQISFTSPKAGRSNSGKTNLLVLMSILGLMAIAAILYLALRKTESDVTPVETNSIAISDSSRATVIADSVALAAISAVVKDGYTYKIVFKDYNNREAAEKGQSKFTSFGHKVLLRTVDSSRYLLLIPFTTAIADSASSLDSLGRLFNYPTYTIQ